jgi:aminomethyltransferase
MPTKNAVSIASKLLEDPTVNSTSLGACYTVGLEAELCLYGNDLNRDINLVMGALGWTMGGPKAWCRTKQGYLRAEHFLTLEGELNKQQKKRLGIFGMKAPTCDHKEIYNATCNNLIGEMTLGVSNHMEIYDATSENLIREVMLGAFSPCLKAPIAMGYVSTPNVKVGTKIVLKIQNKM